MEHASGTGIYVNWNKTEFIYSKQRVIVTLSGKPKKLVDKFTYLDNNISSSESDAKIPLAFNAIDR